MTCGIAIVGLGCVYADAHSPRELWDNVLAERRAFRQIPSSRLPLSEYVSEDPAALDLSYCSRAAVIQDYAFDRLKYRISSDAYRRTDFVHWLSLDVATRCLADANFPDGQGLPRATTGVLVGNTLTGEFSRANTLRLRWPYVRAVVREQLIASEIAPAQRAQIIEALEDRYKAPFPSMSEESLAGGLSNTIAGRICNYYDLGGGGYVLDGACSSSLLAAANACRALTCGELDVALVGGVDLSLDPFELVGFARLGALATDEMRIYDERPSGFLPGEGCGFIALMREADAIATAKPIYAVIKGWGISSDGAGGLTRPEVAGQRRAIERAYHLAGYSAASVGLFEGHGTGTTVGDPVELKAIISARQHAAAPLADAAIGSIKANIGHTKAAAGIAGLMKAALAIKEQIRPASTGVHRPHSLFSAGAAGLRVLRNAEVWQASEPRAGVSSFGFGGINVHVALTGVNSTARRALSSRERVLRSSSQDCEVFLFSAPDLETLRGVLGRHRELASHLSDAQLGDLAVQLGVGAARDSVRAAVVASSPTELRMALEWLLQSIEQGHTKVVDVSRGAFLSVGSERARVVLLFPGQGSPVHISGGAMARRFHHIEELYARGVTPANVLREGGPLSTAIVQPAVVLAELAALHVFDTCELDAAAAVGHSLGELVALCWAGVIRQDTAISFAQLRGNAMSQVPGEGAMASIGAPLSAIQGLLRSVPGICTAAVNSPAQTIVAGARSDVLRAIEVAGTWGWSASELKVAHAFHSPLMAPAQEAVQEFLSSAEVCPPSRRIYSTVSGTALLSDTDVKALLLRQLTSPVLFQQAFSEAVQGADLCIEAGPGTVLCDLASRMSSTPAIAVDASGASLRGFCLALGASYALGSLGKPSAFFAERHFKSIAPDQAAQFLSNPCALVPISPPEERCQVRRIPADNASVHEDVAAPGASAIDVLRRLVSERAEIPLELVKPETKLLADLHLNSITIGHLVAQAARQLRFKAPVAPSEFALATVGQVADALQALRDTGTSHAARGDLPDGYDAWVHPLVVRWIESAPTKTQTDLPGDAGHWQACAVEAHDYARTLEHALNAFGGSGVAVLLPPRAMDEELILHLLRVTREYLASAVPGTFLLIQHDTTVAPFARALHFENPESSVCVIDAPIDEQLIPRVQAELSGLSGYREVRYDERGKRYVPRLQRAFSGDRVTQLPLSKMDVILISGGAKGIAAECAYQLAKRSGASLALLGRSEPQSDEEVRKNLRRLSEQSIRYEYVSADVCSLSQVESAVRTVTARLGPITAVIHAAGINEPARITALTDDNLIRTCRIKVDGLRHLLTAVDRKAVRLLVSFGSIIAHTGLAGESHYGIANEWLARLTEAHATQNEHCRCVTLEWSVWADVGMGERLGSVERLARQGIAAIQPDQGVSALMDVLRGAQRGRLIVSGRVPDLPTLQWERPPLPVLRFLESIPVHFPGIELICESTLRVETDLYLADHVVTGNGLFPAVLGLEAMAEAAQALSSCSEPLTFEEVVFSHAIVVPASGEVTLRLIAQAEDDDSIVVVTRCSSTGFATDHFRARCRFVRTTQELQPLPQVSDPEPATECLQPYEELLFHRGRFRTVRGYQDLQVRHCTFTVAPGASRTSWFGAFFPQELLLGDPAVRDGVIHGIQACVPHHRLLPIGVQRLIPGKSLGTQALSVHAIEREQTGSTFVYDVEVRSADGIVHERWQGLRLRAIEPIRYTCWQPPLFVLYLNRRLEQLLPSALLKVALRPRANGTAGSDGAARALLGERAQIVRRADGKPELLNAEGHVSLSHSSHLTLAVWASRTVSCDIQEVEERSDEQWGDLLGRDFSTLARVIAGSEVVDNGDASATRLWAVKECLKKCGCSHAAPLIVVEREEDGWIVFGSGSRRIATCVARLAGSARPHAVAVLAGAADETL